MNEQQLLEAQERLLPLTCKTSGEPYPADEIVSTAAWWVAARRSPALCCPFAMKWTFDKLAWPRSIFPAALSGHCNAPRAPARCGMELQCALDKQVHWWCDSPPKSRDIVKDHRPQHLVVDTKMRLE